MAEFKIGDKVEIYEGMLYYADTFDMYVGKRLIVSEEETTIGEIVTVKYLHDSKCLEVLLPYLGNTMIYIPTSAARLCKDQSKSTPPLPKHTIQRKKYSIIGKVIY